MQAHDHKRKTKNKWPKIWQDFVARCLISRGLLSNKLCSFEHRLNQGGPAHLLFWTFLTGMNVTHKASIFLENQSQRVVISCKKSTSVWNKINGDCAAFLPETILRKDFFKASMKSVRGCSESDQTSLNISYILFCRRGRLLGVVTTVCFIGQRAYTPWYTIHTYTIHNTHRDTQYTRHNT